jgi:hypothetical protein
MNVKPYSLLNKRGDKKYGLVHTLTPGSSPRITQCGKPTETALGYWEETEEPLTCPGCSGEPKIAVIPTKVRPKAIRESREKQRLAIQSRGILIKRLYEK